ncbi:MAG: hypothetical protein ACYC1D_12865, partial [Acidimicrobiales bacterium]
MRLISASRSARRRRRRWFCGRRKARRRRWFCGRRKARRRRWFCGRRKARRRRWFQGQLAGGDPLAGAAQRDGSIRADHHRNRSPPAG